MPLHQSGAIRRNAKLQSGFNVPAQAPAATASRRPRPSSWHGPRDMRTTHFGTSSELGRKSPGRPNSLASSYEILATGLARSASHT